MVPALESERCACDSDIDIARDNIASVDIDTDMFEELSDSEHR